MGRASYNPTKAEEASMKLRLSLYISKDMKAGGIFIKDNVRIIRPGYGLPKYYDIVLGKKVKTNIEKGTPLKWEIII